MDRNKTLDGYFTVEATLIMSITLVCVVLLIYIGFYQYDRCLLTQDTYRLALKGSSSQFLDNEEIYQKLSAEINKYYWDKYIGMKISEPSVNVSGGEVIVKIEGSINIPFVFGKTWSISQKSVSKRVIPSKEIRLFRRIQSEEENRK